VHVFQPITDVYCTLYIKSRNTTRLWLAWRYPHNLLYYNGLTRKCTFFSQSQTCIAPCTSNHGTPHVCDWLEDTHI